MDTSDPVVIAAAGLAGIMSEAGLTFFPHIQSKAELVRESVAGALEDQTKQLDETLASGTRVRDLGTLRLARAVRGTALSDRSWQQAQMPRARPALLRSRRTLGFRSVPH